MTESEYIYTLEVSLEHKERECAGLKEQLMAAQRWVSDLQSGMYVNCVYCGHRYGPKDSTPSSMADVLKAHIAQCPQHPMSRTVNLLRSLVRACHYVAFKPPRHESHATNLGRSAEFDAALINAQAFLKEVTPADAG